MVLTLSLGSACLLIAASAAAQIGAPSNLRIEGMLEDVAVVSEANPMFSFVPPPLPVGPTRILIRTSTSTAPAQSELADDGRPARGGRRIQTAET